MGAMKVDCGVERQKEVHMDGKAAGDLVTSRETCFHLPSNGSYITKKYTYGGGESALIFWC